VELRIDGLEDLLRRVVREELAGLGTDDEWLDSREAAEYLGISLGHLHNLRGVVPSHKMGGRRRYRPSELDAYITGGAR
jgi:excisionase family DNA binding protein